MPHLSQTHTLSPLQGSGMNRCNGTYDSNGGHSGLLPRICLMSESVFSSFSRHIFISI